MIVPISLRRVGGFALPTQLRSMATASGGGQPASSHVNFSGTLLLPKTTFPMRSPPSEEERAILKQVGDVYAQQHSHRDRLTQSQELRQCTRRPGHDRATWTLHDGPPYANGDPHVGHALNKVLKDCVNREKLLAGHRVNYVPGWDCHGLPIELQVTQEIQNRNNNNNKKKKKKKKKNKSNEKDKRDETQVNQEAVTAGATPGQSQATPPPPPSSSSVSSTPPTSALDIRRAARQLALGAVERQSAAFQSWGVMGRWSEPYLTMDPMYEARQLEVLARLLDRGLLYRATQPVYWSPVTRTALADAELEYRDAHRSTAIHAAFRLCHSPAGDALGLGPQASLLIWTTTPWTLPANEAVCVGPALQYVELSVADAAGDSVTGGPSYLVARARVDSAAEALGVAPGQLVVRREMPGSALVGLRYRHPWTAGIECPVLAGAHVDESSGTGLVHAAPAHGKDDWVACRALVRDGDNESVAAPDDPRRNLVDAGGCFRASAGADLAGLFALTKGSERVLEALAAGTRDTDCQLVHVDRDYRHRYPYDWRAKAPVIVRATAQWFVRIDSLREQALSRLADQGVSTDPLQEAPTQEAPTTSIQFIPESGRSRLTSMLQTRTDDWCLSRQRAWGVPIPVFYRRQPDDGTARDDDQMLEPVFTSEVVRHVAGLFATHGGSDCWWTLSTDELLPESLRGQDLIRGSDTLDVWFDSGVSWTGLEECSSRDAGSFEPADMYLEGSDQHRGWFQSSLLTAMAATPGGQAPFRRVFTHGFTLDEANQKMSKSIGNVIDPQTIIDQYGLSVLRFWVGSVDVSGDVTIGKTTLHAAGQAVKKIRNTFRFLLGAISSGNEAAGSAGASTIKPAALLEAIQVHGSPGDRWLLRRLARLLAVHGTATAAFDVRSGTRAALQFASSDLSSVYVPFAKDALYCADRRSPGRQAIQASLTLSMVALVRVLAPVLPHLCEEVWMHFREQHHGPSAPPPAGSLFFDPVFAECQRTVARWQAADPAAAASPGDHAVTSMREQINGGIERLRNDKVVGDGLECEAVVRLGAESRRALHAEGWSPAHLANFCGVSFVHLTDGVEAGDPMIVHVQRTQAQKCDRCWRRSCCSPADDDAGRDPFLADKLRDELERSQFSSAPTHPTLSLDTAAPAYAQSTTESNLCVRCATQIFK